MTDPLQPAAKVITVINLKGGVGKTHTVWLLASVCQERAQRVLLLDTDTQGNLTNSFLPGGDGKPGIEALFHPGAEHDALSLVRHTAFSHIDLLPSGPALAPFDLANQRNWEKADLHFTLREAIAPLKGSYDFLVIDCPPRLSLVSFAALCASEFVLIPMEAADWGAQGILQVSAAIRYVQKHYNPGLKLLGYVVSRFKTARAYQRSYLQQLRGQFGAEAFDTVLPDLARFEKSVCERLPITLHSPGSREAGIARTFFDEVTGRIQGFQGGGGIGRPAGVPQQAVAAA